MSGELQVCRWIRRNQEILDFSWTPGREPNPGFDGLIEVVRFEDQPKLGPAVLYDRPIDSAYTRSVEQFLGNTDTSIVRLGTPKSEARHDRAWSRRPPMELDELQWIFAKIRAEPPPGTFFDPYWTRAQLEHREWYSVHGLVKRDGGLHEVIVLCCCPPDPPTVSARAALVQVEAELGYDFAAAEVYRTHCVGPAVSGIRALRIERRIRSDRSQIEPPT